MIDDFLKKNLSDAELGQMTNEMYINALAGDPHFPLEDPKRKKQEEPVLDEAEIESRLTKELLFQKLKSTIHAALREYTGQD